MAVLVSQKRRVAPVYRTATELYIARQATKINPAPGEAGMRGPAKPINPIITRI
jgi:hypothetical protein